MVSSNRHWPSMFKAKPCSNLKFQHDSLICTGGGCNKSPYFSGCDEKTPEPKPRWNPKPEQIRILEAIFNSGIVNPPRDEIRKIRIQLQEYGQVGDANVFYWFQNRKSRRKNKLRNLNKVNQKQNSSSSSSSQSPLQNNNLVNSSSSSNSSEKSSFSPKDQMLVPSNFSIDFSNVVTDMMVPISPTASVNQTLFQPHNDTIVNLIPTTTQPESFFPLYHHGQGGVVSTTTTNDSSIATTQGYDFVSEIFHQQGQQPYRYGQQPYRYGQQSAVDPCTTDMLLSEIMSHHEASSKYKYLHDQDEEAIKIMNQQNQSQCFSFCQASTTNSVPSITTTAVTVPPSITQFQGVGDAAGTARSTVFINDVAFEVCEGTFNVREAFGDAAVLVQSSGHPVLTDEWGVTLHPLQHGASYYLI